MHRWVALSATWLPALLAQQEVEGQPEDIRHMLSGVRLIAIVALILLLALLVYLMKKL
jgi:hypothetical protein